MTSHSTVAPECGNRPKVYGRLSRDDVLGALRRMHRIRRFQEAAEDSYIRGLSYGTMHLSVGQEATAVGICMPLSDADCITSTHRGHGHCIAKGAKLIPMFAEFLGRESGYCKGRGGSMHIAEPARGNLGANGIVGGGLPIAVGAALSAKKRRTGAVAVAFFGDGANNEGAFHEALNLASIWKLPVVFVCENNQYAMSMAISRSTSVANVADRASAYAMPGVIVDGNDFAAVAEASFAATERARAGDGPTLFAIDLPGHGLTPLREAASFEALVEAARSAMIEEGAAEAHLVGHSLGGAVAAALSEAPGVKALSLMLIAPAGLGEEMNPAFFEGFLQADTEAALRPRMNLLVTDPASLGAAMVAATLRQRAEQKLVPAQRRLLKTLLADGRQTIDIRDCLAAPKIPVKVVIGGEDRITPARHAENLGGLVAVHRFPKIGHMPHFEARREVARLIEELTRAGAPA